MSDFFRNQSWPRINLAKLLDGDFWLRPVNLIAAEYFLFYFFAVLIIIVALAVMLSTVKRRHRQVPVYGRVINHLANQIVFVAVVALSYWFFLVQGINYLSSWLVALAGLMILAVWLVYLGYLWRRRLPKERELYLEKEKFFRYLPSNAQKRR
ncbi:MAG: hypothetical protein AAB499_01995 [Patescibacteria group bacterium]